MPLSFTANDTVAGGHLLHELVIWEDRRLYGPVPPQPVATDNRYGSARSEKRRPYIRSGAGITPPPSFSTKSAQAPWFGHLSVISSKLDWCFGPRAIRRILWACGACWSRRGNTSHWPQSVPLRVASERKTALHWGRMARTNQARHPFLSGSYHPQGRSAGTRPWGLIAR